MPIVIKNLTKKYDDVIAVNNINLEIKDNDLFALLGVNGAGKTTLIKMLSTLLKPTSGEAYINDLSIIKNEDEVKEIIDISMQETAIGRKLTVEENIVFYGELNGLSKEEISEVKSYLYKVFSLDKVKNRKSCNLSGGWQRKLSIALALISKPKVLFLDEPTLGLDVISRRELWKTIESLKDKMTIILTTHYMEEAESLSSRIGIMSEGNLLFVGTKEELFTHTNRNSVEEGFISVVSGGKNYE